MITTPNDNSKIRNFSTKDEPISWKVALESGWFSYQGSYIRPIDENIAKMLCDRLGRQVHYRQQIYIIPANKSYSPALTIGGTTHTLEELATLIGANLNMAKKDNYIPLTSLDVIHNKEKDKDLRNLSSKYLIEEELNKFNIPIEYISDAPVSVEKWSFISDKHEKESDIAWCFHYPSGLEHWKSFYQAKWQKWSPVGKRTNDPSLWIWSSPRENKDKNNLYLCEGETDALAMGQWGFIAMGIPGAKSLTSSRVSWLFSYLKNNYKDINKIRISFDNDKAGKDGTSHAYKLLSTKFENIEYLSWSKDSKNGEDLRDLSLKYGDSFPESINKLTWLSVLDDRDDEEFKHKELNRYKSTDSGMYKIDKDGDVTKLSNFSAKIIEKYNIDVGNGFIDDESSHKMVIRYKIKGKEGTVCLNSKNFRPLNWIHALSGNAIVEAGSHIRDHARACIEHSSKDIDIYTVYGHIGYKYINNSWVYLFNDGAITEDGIDTSVKTDLPETISHYNFKNTSGKNDKICDFAKKIIENWADLASIEVSIPLLGAIFRSVLGVPCPFSLFLEGPTGTFKTSIAGVAQSFFGRAMLNQVPTDFSSTANSLELISFLAADALLTVDDVVPGPGPNGYAQFSERAERIFRAQGNTSGRHRMARGGGLETAYRPRGLIVSTGEVVPPGESLRARLFILGLDASTVSKSSLTEWQSWAAEGRTESFMENFIRWNLAYRDNMDLFLRQRVSTIASSIDGSHPRYAHMVGHLFSGLDHFLLFCQSYLKIISIQDRKSFGKIWIKTLKDTLENQKNYIGDSDPVDNFLQVIRSSLSRGQIFLEDRHRGGVPDSYEYVCGYRQKESRWEALFPGNRVGFIDTKTQQILLDPTAAYQYAMQTSAVKIDAKTLWKRMRQRSVTLCHGKDRNLSLVRTFIGRIWCLVLSFKSIIPCNEEL